MDPLVIAANTRPIVFFLTRSDVFTPFMKPILWAAHMIPIYRQQDGVDTKGKNKEVFQECSQILIHRRNLLIFGEGFTDDVFVRRLKPLKKGAARIGFETLQKLNWSKDVYVQTIGVNYGNPNVVNSEVLIRYGEKIRLNDYQADFEADANKTIATFTHFLEKNLQEQLTHVEVYDWAFFHEEVMRITRLGLHPIDSDFSIPLEKRWENSQRFAQFLNQQDLKSEETQVLKRDLSNYFQELTALQLSDTVIYEQAEHYQKTGKKILQILVFLPFSILGIIHHFVPYVLAKKFTEKQFKRKVFWGSVKMMMSIVFSLFWNLPLVIFIHHFLFRPWMESLGKFAWIVSILYFFTTPIFGKIAYQNHRIYQNLRAHHIHSDEIKQLAEKRRKLLQRILPTFFSE